MSYKPDHVPCSRCLPDGRCPAFDAAVRLWPQLVEAVNAMPKVGSFMSRPRRGNLISRLVIFLGAAALFSFGALVGMMAVGRFR